MRALLKYSVVLLCTPNWPAEEVYQGHISLIYLGRHETVQNRAGSALVSPVPILGAGRSEVTGPEAESQGGTAGEGQGAAG